MEKLFSGTDSQDMWQSIHNLNAVDTVDDVANVLLEICHRIMLLEDRFTEFTKETGIKK